MYKIEIDGPKTLECDVLVIGSGAGGSAVANTLAKAGVNVLIVEEGPEINPNHPPAGLSLSMQEIWRNGGLTSTLGTQIAYAEGRSVGGGTQINSAIFQSAPGEILDEWRASNNIDNFSVAEMNQYYKRAIAAVHASEVVADDTSGANLRQATKLMGWRLVI